MLCGKLMIVGHRHCQKKGKHSYQHLANAAQDAISRCLKGLLTPQTPHTNQIGKICARSRWNKGYKQNTHKRLWARLALYRAELASVTSQSPPFSDYHCRLLSVCANCQKGIVINNEAQPPDVSNQTHTWHSLAAQFFRCTTTKQNYSNGTQTQPEVGPARLASRNPCKTPKSAHWNVTNL